MRIGEGYISAADRHWEFVLRDFRGSYCNVQCCIRKRLGLVGKKSERAGLSGDTKTDLAPRSSGKENHPKM